MKRALVLAGGGARGAYQVGMLHELIGSRGLDFSIIRGVSVGALNAAFLAQASLQGGSASLREKVEDLDRLWTGIRGNHDIYAERGGFAAIAAGADSLYSLEPLKRLIRENISVRALRESGRDFAVGTVSLLSGYYQEWKPRHRKFLEKLTASASIPAVFPFVDIESEHEILVDGGVRNITPLSGAFSALPDEIYVLLTSKMIRKGNSLPESCVQVQTYRQWDDNWLGTKISGINVLGRTIEILTDEIYLDDVRGALHWNSIADSVRELKKASKGRDLPADVRRKIQSLGRSLKKARKRAVPIYVLAPRQWYGEKNKSTDFSPLLIKEALEHGREIARDPSLWVWPQVLR